MSIEANCNLESKESKINKLLFAIIKKMAFFYLWRETWSRVRLVRKELEILGHISCIPSGRLLSQQKELKIEFRQHTEFYLRP